MILDDPVSSLKGVGEKTEKTLKKHGIKTVRDFFYNLPREYENYESPISISQIQPGKVVIKGKIDSLATRRTRRRNLSVTEGVIRDTTGAVKVVWFNQRYREHQFDPNKEYYFTGSFELRNGRYSLVSPSTAEVSHIDPMNGLSPVYVAHGSLKSMDFRRLMLKSRDLFISIPDMLPTVKSNTRAKALFYAHFPASQETIRRSHEYLAYEELFELILASRLNRRENEKLKAKPIPFDLDEMKKFLNGLPFTLTGAQKKAIWQIVQDMERVTPMNRLLQGDVGSGKTMVAAAAAYEVALTGAQVAILAPTAILANQHYEGLKHVLEPLGIKMALLTGATKKKTDLKRQIRSGAINLVIGTHALLTDDTEFDDLALVVIDEQHRFGVEQRQKLMLKSPDDRAPHLLAMTATPIPRSLQLTIFGDLDISILNELPSGRQPIITSIITGVEVKEKLYPKMREILNLPPDRKRPGAKAHGQQIYWVCKAIEDEKGNLSSEVTSVKTRASRLKEAFQDKTVAFLHGKMKSPEKDTVMEKFANGEIDILVSTTVIEVGVDVPNATLMVIENAESYGLAQLHQLRGRVGRGESAAFCYLLTSGDLNPSRRLKELEKSTDGFYLAEMDLKMRGPGEIYGALQHGALDLKIASLSDTRLIARVQKDVSKFLRDSDNLIKWKELMNGITKYQQLTTLN